MRFSAAAFYPSFLSVIFVGGNHLMKLNIYICILLLLLCFQSVAQVKTTQAVKANQPPKIDGLLDDAAWTNAPVLEDFVQNYPLYGGPCSKRTAVKILYDNSAVYVGAYLYDDPSLIRKQFTARDGEQQTDVDYFSVFFDTYNDKQNGFQFLVTSANVQTDARLTPTYTGDFGSYGDKTWDAVWESKVSTQADGWIVEIRIPYISLRFAKKDVQDWGLQLLRFMRRNNETSFWNPVNPQVNGFVNQFGGFTNLQKIEPPLRLSFSPYVTTGYRTSPVGNTYLKEWLRNGGMDVKYGINESFTLDATLIPDFGQVISDNVVNNLTPYEVQFQENRQFFTEGTEIFNKAKLFYSRRVGAMPGGYFGILDSADTDPNIEIIKNPSSTQLYNAIKFSGRNRKKFGIGIFNAVTAPMHAIIRNRTTNEEAKIETEPLANYNILVLDQALKGRSYITFTNTNVLRNGNARDANVSALDIALYDKGNIHALRGTVRYSKIWGTDPYDGYNTTFSYGKVSGNWLYNFSSNVESKNYDPNDLGILAAPNEVTYRANLTYRQFKQTKSFLQQIYALDYRLQYLYKPFVYSSHFIKGTSFWIFRNFWDLSIEANITPIDVHDYFELRTEDLYLNYPLNIYTQVEGSTDSRKKLFFRYLGIAARLPKFNNNLLGAGIGFRYRFNNKFSIDLQVDKNKEENNVGFAFAREASGEPIVGRRDIKVNTTIFSGIYSFTPRLNLTFRARHYWNEIKYLNYYNVNDKGNLINRAFITGLDENFNIFNVDGFLNWDFSLGSKLILGYKNWLGDDEQIPFPNSGKNSYLRNLAKIFERKHGNEFTVRLVYFIDANKFKRR